MPCFSRSFYASQESNFPRTTNEKVCIFRGSAKVTLKPTKDEHRTLQVDEGPGQSESKGRGGIWSWDWGWGLGYLKIWRKPTCCVHKATSGPNMSTANIFSGNLEIVPLSWRRRVGTSGNCSWRSFEIILLGKSERVLLIKRWRLAVDKVVDRFPCSRLPTHTAQQGLASPWYCTNSSISSREPAQARLLIPGPALPLGPLPTWLEAPLASA